MISRIAIAALFLIGALSMANATTYYVATTGNDSNAGTSGSPWLTIGKAAATLVAGDTAIVRNGTYVSSSVVFDTSGTAGNPITFQAENKWLAIISSTAGCSASVYVFKSYITIKDFRIALDPSNAHCTVYGAQSTSIWARGSSNPTPSAPDTLYHHLTVDGVYIDNTNFWLRRSLGIKSNQDNTTIKNSTVYGSIEGFNSVNFTVNNNISYTNGASSFEPQINIKGGARNAKVFNNIVHAGIDGVSGLQLGGNGSGYWWDSTLFNGSISGTTLTVTAIQSGAPISLGFPITENEGFGVVSGTTINSQLTGTTGSTGTYVVSVSQTVSSREMFESRTNIELYNSVAYDNVIINEAPGGNSNAVEIRGCSNCTVSNNVLTNNESLGIETGSETGFPPISKSTNPRFINNIMSGTGGCATLCGVFGWSGNANGTLTVDHNNLYNYGSNIPTQTNAVAGNPLFVNVASDWHLQAGSPDIAAGTTVNVNAYGGGSIDVSNDYDGVTRSAPWDLGIYKTVAGGGGSGPQSSIFLFSVGK